MDSFISSQLIQSLGIVGIPILTVTAVVYYLFKLLQERDEIMRGVVDGFNKTIQEHLTTNTMAINMMMKSFEEWRDISSREHERILDNQTRIIDKIK